MIKIMIFIQQIDVPRFPRLCGTHSMLVLWLPDLVVCQLQVYTKIEYQSFGISMLHAICKPGYDNILRVLVARGS